jgi:hypothetical protein
MALPLLLAAMAASLGASPGIVVFDNPNHPACCTTTMPGV